MNTTADIVGQGPVSDDDLRWFARWACRQVARASRERQLFEGHAGALDGGTPKARALANKAAHRARMLTELVKDARAFDDVVFPGDETGRRVTVDHLGHVLLRRKLHEHYASEPANAEPTLEQRRTRVAIVAAFCGELTPGQARMVQAFDRFEHKEEPARLAKRLVEKVLGSPAKTLQTRIQALCGDWPPGPLNSVGEKVLNRIETFRWAAMDREGDCHPANEEAAHFVMLEAFEFKPRTLVHFLETLLVEARRRLGEINRAESVEWVADQLVQNGFVEDERPAVPACIFCNGDESKPLIQRGPVCFHADCAARIDPDCSQCRGRGFVVPLVFGRPVEPAPCLCSTAVRFNQPDPKPADGPPKSKRKRRITE